MTLLEVLETQLTSTMGVRRREYGRPITATPVGFFRRPDAPVTDSEGQVGPVGIGGSLTACIRDRGNGRGLRHLDPAGFVA
jgi:hypothetical protein